MKRFMFVLFAIVAVCSMATAQTGGTAGDAVTAMIDLTGANGIAVASAGDPGTLALAPGVTYHDYPVVIAGTPTQLLDPADPAGDTPDPIEWQITSSSGLVTVVCSFILPSGFTDAADAPGAVLPITYGPMDAMAWDPGNSLLIATWSPLNPSPVLPVVGETDVYLGYTVKVPALAPLVSGYSAIFYMTATITGM